MLQVNKEKLSELILEYKAAHNLTYEMMGDACNRNASVFCRLANMVNDPDFDTISVVADYIGADPMVDILKNGDEEYLNLSRLPEDKRAAIEKILKG